jgi:thiol-disulfide isomerase/thioredoxin
MKAARAAALVLALGHAALAANLVDSVRTAADARNFTLAEREIQGYRTAVGVTPEMLEALSWLARGALDAKQYDRADGYAGETRDLIEKALAGRPVPPSLEIALGAAIEVHAAVLAASGNRPEAIGFLRTELAAYRSTALSPRIQKNINMLTLEGKPAPALDVSHWLGPQPRSLTALKGHPVLLFFWAHWCVDCKAEAPILARLMQEYGPRGLVLVGPTQLYGYTAASDATPEQETRYIDQVRTQYYAPLAAMPVPISAENFQKYGASTTPTLVLLDSSGVVRLYHPGAMSYEALAEKIKRIFGVRGA